MHEAVRSHREAMEHALRAAAQAPMHGDVPVGAVVVHQGVVIAVGTNTRERDCDPTGHAELQALRAAGAALGRWRLHDCSLYVTLEPCPMCAPALAQARLDRVVFGAYDPRQGAAGSVFSLLERPEHGHFPEVIGGIAEERCRELLQAFFAARRAGS